MEIRNTSIPYKTIEVMLQECEIKFQIGEGYTGIVNVIEEKDLFYTKDDFIKSLKDDDTIKGYVYLGRYTFKDVGYDVYQIFFNDCEECNPVFIGLRDMMKVFEFKYKSPKITGIKNIHFVPCDYDGDTAYPRYSLLQMMRQLKNYRRFITLWIKEYNGVKYKLYSVSFTDGAKTYFGIED